MFLKKIGVKLRLTLIFVLIFGLSTLAFNALSFISVLKLLQKDFDTALYNYAVDVSNVVELLPSGDLAIPLLRMDDGKILPFPLGTALISVRHASGEILAEVGSFGEFKLPYKRAFEDIWSGHEVHFETIEDVTRIPQAEAENYRMVSFSLDETEKPQLLLQIAVPLTLLETQLANRLWLLQIGTPLLIIFATILGYLFASRALKPVQEMTRTAQLIHPEELSQRLPVPQASDEIQSLALTMNEMLSRIQNAFKSQERFVSEASHQLFSPLTILKGEIELALKNQQLEQPQQREVFLRGLLVEVDHLTKLVHDMLLLARVESGAHQLEQNKIYLDEVFTDVMSRVQKLAQKRRNQVQLKMTGAEENRRYFFGAPDLIFQLIYNLLENALKYSLENSTIQVSIDWSLDHVDLHLTNIGEPIRQEDLHRIFERFHRSDSVTGKTSGYGLGLAICQKIAKLHQAVITVKAEGPLSHFQVRFLLPTTNIMHT